MWAEPRDQITGIVGIGHSDGLDWTLSELELDNEMEDSVVDVALVDVVGIGTVVVVGTVAASDSTLVVDHLEVVERFGRGRDSK